MHRPPEEQRGLKGPRRRETPGAGEERKARGHERNALSQAGVTHESLPKEVRNPLAFLRARTKKSGRKARYTHAERLGIARTHLENPPRSCWAESSAEAVGGHATRIRAEDAITRALRRGFRHQWHRRALAVWAPLKCPSTLDDGTVRSARPDARPGRNREVPAPRSTAHRAVAHLWNGLFLWHPPQLVNPLLRYVPRASIREDDHVSVGVARLGRQQLRAAGQGAAGVHFEQPGPGFTRRRLRASPGTPRSA